VGQGNQTSTASLRSQLGTFGRTFWVANTIEMFERLAYYGLRTVLPIYMVLSIEEGGPQFDHVQKGLIFGWWALVQSMIPVFTGGYADRYGYKLTVGISIAIKVVGYLVMAFAVDAASQLTGDASLAVPGHPTTFWIFCSGALILALGTAVFKPGIQGILAHQLNSENESTGWAVFYQLVNLGAWFGPFLAGYLRILDWKYVFIACAIIVSFNYLLLLAFPEPEQEPTAEPAETSRSSWNQAFRVFWQSGIGICEPRLMSFLVIYSGFWFMFNQLFDILPNFIDQWIDSRDILARVTSLLSFEAPTAWGGHLPQEYMINLNAGMIMVAAFSVGYLTGKLRSLTAILSGMLVSAAAIYAIGFSMNGWVVLGAIALFSLGEMMASPTTQRYFASIAPPGKKGLYLGYVNATNGIGWYIGSIVAGTLYQEKGDLYVLARRHLIDSLGADAESIATLAQGDVLVVFAERTGLTRPEIQKLLWDTYSPEQIWPYFATIGLVSMIGLILFDQITRRSLRFETAWLAGLTVVVAGYSYGLGYAIAFVLPMLVYMAISIFAPAALPQGQSEGASPDPVR
jgi:dipeptide/tripeptide permease